MVSSAIKSILLGSAAAVSLAAPVSAATILLHDIGGAAQVTGTQAELGFKIAAKYWESVLTNNATIELKVGYGGLPTGVLGSTGSSLAQFVPISAYYDALNATKTSALDSLAVANLSPLNGNGGVSALVPSYLSPATSTGIDVAGGTRLAPDNAINSTLALTTANAKALGANFGPSFIDGTIQFSNQFAFDFNPTDGIQAGSYDFIGVAIHEIGHALGFVSGADDFDYANGYAGPVDDAWWAYGLDMFRYSGAGQLNWAPNQPSYFSVDGGATSLWNGYFSTGETTGDGNQASHWKEPNQATPCDDFLGVMNPYICGGKMDSVTALDLAAFDAIGWNVNFDVLANPRYELTTAQIYEQFATPEPASWSMAAVALFAAGLVTRRRKQQA
ncbi:NF038122 family metalloprotease [Pelomonas sp. P7]|uniref:NF038122 family metalloprotease n=1 Tax=Pelomonas caseinilytica TaxID=2906763 RepID=A0ABS8XKW9_9BURK|nr:NF038122 family metalloprotease [Pelomonas sp. P7]MCE4540335.1 NF038122 family metalloprotease [Pelomonas sp. P7]